MSKINELYSEINNLSEKIEKESKNALRRKIKIDLEIEELENEKKRAGLRNDFSSVQNYNFKIDQLKQKKIL